MDAVKTHLRSKWPVSMPPLHAGTQEERMTREKGKKQYNTHGRNKRQAGKAPPRPSTWPATPHQPSNTHTASSHPPGTKRKRESPPPPPVQSHGQRDTATAPHTKHTKQAITQRATRGSNSASIHDVATKFPAISPKMGFGARLKAVIGGASRLQEE
ncbi:hypothetical protein TcG_10377 [Trypanosoma cruzi]|nr:hypothetical protein TcG_10377 [Trypanosoma cruzi]